MGKTIRREPVTSSIPAAPDYKFLNITNFSGLEKSSNPFVVNSNTASDCLNVYVDEDNALATRPRLNLISNLMSLANVERHTLIGVYNLHNGYLLHTVMNNNASFHVISTDNDTLTVKEITKHHPIPLEKCVVYEQNDVIYILSGTKYTQIKDGKHEVVCDNDDTYIPTTKIGKWEPIADESLPGYLTDGKSYESMNLLNKKYKETYFWDGVWNYYPETLGAVKVVNDYMRREYVLDLPKNSNNTILQFMPAISNLEDGVFYVLIENIPQHKLFLATIDRTFNILSEVNIPIGNPSGQPTNAMVSANGLVVAGNLNRPDAVYIRRRKNISDTTFENINTNVEGVVMGVSSDGSKILIHGYAVDDNSVKVMFVQEDGSFSLHEVYNNGSGTFLYNAGQNATGDKYILIDSVDNSLEYLDITNESESYTTTQITLPTGGSAGFYHDIILSPKENDNSFMVIYSDGANNAVSTYAIYSEPSKVKYYETNIINYDFPVAAVWSSSGENIFCMGANGNDFILKIKEDTVAKLPGLKIPLLNTWFVGLHKRFGCYATDTELFCWCEIDDERRLQKLRLTIESAEPLLTITRELSEEDGETFQTYEKLRNLLEASTLVQRFDNQVWYASGNTTFHSAYNNPVYVPIDSYNTLGEDYSIITGLCIVNDDILAAYKNDKIYIITKVSVGDYNTYSYTETKNIVGNDVVNAPIVTVLTEMPLIVSYDGVFALNQLQNVQSSDRITTLISGNVNSSWLKESKSDVSSCLTMNRLYWTYFILPHKKIKSSTNKDKDYTKIYLLDNRTQSWFYWELPIYVVSAMVKNNKTHFISSDGNLYSLETTDIVNKFNKELTEYYDDLTKPTLIPWHWTSQILSLNTINYSKRLVDTTFVLTDTDSSDQYALNYKFKAFRKNKNAETTELTLSNDIEYVESITKRTMIPRFNFLQFTLSNTDDDQQLNNNKLRLVGIGLKYVLLGGLY